MKLGESEFLNWVADRFVHVYGESPNVDFVHDLRRLAQEAAKREPWRNTGGNGDAKEVWVRQNGTRAAEVLFFRKGACWLNLWDGNQRAHTGAGGFKGLYDAQQAGEKFLFPEGSS